MLLGKDEDGNAGEQNIERIVVIKNITGRTLRLGVNDRREYREKKPRDTDAVEYDLLFAAEIPTAEIVSADEISGEAEREKFKRWSVAIMLAYGLMLVLFSNVAVLDFLILPMAVGIAAQAFTVSPAGYGFLHFIDRVLDFSKG